MRRRTAKAGFSLVELIAALAIFSFSAVAVVEIYGNCVRASSINVNQARASLLVQGLLEEALAERDWLPGEETGDFGSRAEGFTWTRSVDETQTRGLYEVRATVTWQEPTGPRTFEAVTLAASRE